MRLSKDWLPVLYVFLFLGFALYWYGIYRSSNEGGFIAFIAYPLLIFVSLIPAVIVAIIYRSSPMIDIRTHQTYIITYVILNFWVAFGIFGF